VEWVETTGKTVDEAKDLALDQLGVDAKDAEFELVEEPKSGLFGRTRGVARVRARIVPLAPPAKTERRRRTKKGDDRPEGSGDQTALPDTVTGSSTTEHGAGTAAASKSSTPASSGADGATAGSSGGRRRASGPSRSGSDTPREPMDEKEQMQVLEEFLTELATSFGLTATPSSTMVDNELTVDLAGDDLGLLVGPRLATLDAVQEIARNTLQRQAGSREYAKVRVDVNGIRSRRSESLTEFVTGAGQQVLDDDVEVVFEVMSSVDRKQVHDVAAGIEGVASSSEGEDPRRRVVLRHA